MVSKQANIPVMNVTRQYDSIETEVNAEVLKVLKSGKYILGDTVSKFEQDFAMYCGAKYGIGVGNGTDALVIALRSINIGLGDEVITSAMSFFATAEAISAVGATPVFCDCDRNTYTIDTSEIEEKITSRTKAIIAIHLYGQCSDMDEINRIAKKHGIYVVEDMAQAAGAEYKGRKAGTLADVACVSFFPTKNLGCAGDGGMILTNNEMIANNCRSLRVHGSGKEGAIMAECDFDFDSIIELPKYYNFVSGYNSRLDAIQAAILEVKIKYLDEWNEKRIEIANLYSEKIRNKLVRNPIVGRHNKHVYYVYIVQVNNREHFRNHLLQNNILSGVYFPVPLHLQEAFKGLGYKKGEFPVAEQLAEHNVAIPIFPELNEKEKYTIIDSINRYEE